MSKKPTRSEHKTQLDLPAPPSIPALTEAAANAPTLTIDYGVARVNEFGGVEIVLLEEKRAAPAGAIESVATIAYEPDEFVARCDANAEFADALFKVAGRTDELAKRAEERLTALRSMDPSHFTLMPAYSVSCEAMTEVCYHASRRAGVVWLGVPPIWKHYGAAVVGGHGVTVGGQRATEVRVPLSVVLSASMTARALAGLLVSWEVVADEIRKA